MRARHFTPTDSATSTNDHEAGSMASIHSMSCPGTLRNGLIILNQALILASGLLGR
jgi:hypothetical protein